MGSAKAVEKMSVNVPRDKFMAVIGDYESLPKFIPDLKKVKVDTQKDNMAMVTYTVSIMGREITYTLQHTTYKPGSVSWKLVRGDMMKQNEGQWTIEEAGPNACNVTYELAMTFPIIVPSAIVAQLQKNSLPKLMQQYKERAEALYGRK